MRKRRGKLVFKGVIFRIYQWRQRLFDGTYATFERATRPSVAHALASINGKIAIVHEEQPVVKKTYGLIGGLIDKGESPLYAAKRELLEESGMVAQRWKLIKRVDYSERVRYSVWLYGASNCRKVKDQDLDPGERIEIKRVSLPKLLSMVNHLRLDYGLKQYFTEVKYNSRERAALKKILFGHK